MVHRLLDARLVERRPDKPDLVHGPWQTRIDLDDEGESLRAELRTAIAREIGSEAKDDVDAALPRFVLEWRFPSGAWREFRAGS